MNRHLSSVSRRSFSLPYSLLNFFLSSRFLRRSILRFTVFRQIKVSHIVTVSFLLIVVIVIIMI